MSDDIVKRLRAKSTVNGWDTQDVLSGEAADEIEHLRSELAAVEQEYETTIAELQKIGEEFGVYGGEKRTDGIRRVLSEMRAELAAARMENTVLFGTSHPEIYKTGKDEIAELRAELADAKKDAKIIFEAGQTFATARDALLVRAENAEAELAAAHQAFADSTEALQSAVKQRDALRAANARLREALDAVVNSPWREGTENHRKTINRARAALNDGGE